MDPDSDYQDILLTSPDIESLYPFPDEIIIQDRKTATLYARHILDQGPIERFLVMWVDASVQTFPPGQKANRLSTSAVTYRDSSSQKWTDSVTFNPLQHGTPYGSLWAEFVAIQEALRTACGLTDSFDRLLIFSDCQSILKSIKTKSEFRSLPKKDVVNNVFMYANALYDLGISVELRWVPAHSDIEGNERADKLASRCRRTAESLLAQKLLSDDVVVKDVTITSGSPGGLRTTLLNLTTHQWQHGSENIGSKKRTSLYVDRDAAPRKKRKLESQS